MYDPDRQLSPLLRINGGWALFDIIPFPIPPSVERHDAPDVADLPALRQLRPPGPDDFKPEPRAVIREHGPEPRTSVADPGRPGNGSIRDTIGLWPETVADRGPRASRDGSYVPGLDCSGSWSIHVQSYATQRKVL